MSVIASVETPPAANEANSRSFARAFTDLKTGLDQRELWAHLGWQDIKQRYRRSFLGPIWITIATGATAVAMGLMYSVLFGQDIAVLLPHITIGLIVWGMISGCILEGAAVFASNVGLITQLPAPLSVHVYRLVWRQLLLFAHNLIIYFILLAVFQIPIHWTVFTAFFALALLALNGVWVGIVAGIVATRFRDIQPILESVVQLLFFMTPIVWMTDTIRQNGGRYAERSKLAELNPLYHYLEIIRAPMLGKEQHLYHWLIVIAITVAGWALALVALRNYRARVPYWV